MKLRQVDSVVSLGKWLQSRGFTPSEHSAFGGVRPVHTMKATNKPQCAPGNSLHYCDQALDVNDNDVADDRLPFDDEREALNWLFDKLLRKAQEFEWPLDELFFFDKGFIKERGFEVNHPIGNHESHLHVAFTAKNWTAGADRS